MHVSSTTSGTSLRETMVPLDGRSSTLLGFVLCTQKQSLKPLLVTKCKSPSVSRLLALKLKICFTGLAKRRDEFSHRCRISISTIRAGRGKVWPSIPRRLQPTRPIAPPPPLPTAPYADACADRVRSDVPVVVQRDRQPTPWSLSRGPVTFGYSAGVET